MDWKDIIRVSAPAIGTALGGPAAGIATKFIAEKFLGKSDASIDEIANAVQSATPQDLAKLKEIESQFLIEQGAQVVQLLQIDASDRENARLREQTMVQSGDRTTPRLAYLVIIGSMIMSVYVLYMVNEGDVNTEECTIIGFLVGHFLSEVKQVLSYYFGGNSGVTASNTLSKRQ